MWSKQEKGQQTWEQEDFTSILNDLEDPQGINPSKNKLGYVLQKIVAMTDNQGQKFGGRFWQMVVKKKSKEALFYLPIVSRLLQTRWKSEIKSYFEILSSIFDEIFKTEESLLNWKRFFLPTILKENINRFIESINSCLQVNKEKIWSDGLSNRSHSILLFHLITFREIFVKLDNNYRSNFYKSYLERTHQVRMDKLDDSIDILVTAVRVHKVMCWPFVLEDMLLGLSQISSDWTIQKHYEGLILWTQTPLQRVEMAMNTIIHILKSDLIYDLLSTSPKPLPDLLIGVFDECLNKYITRSDTEYCLKSLYPLLKYLYSYHISHLNDDNINNKEKKNQEQEQVHLQRQQQEQQEEKEHQHLQHQQQNQEEQQNRRQVQQDQDQEQTSLFQQYQNQSMDLMLFFLSRIYTLLIQNKFQSKINNVLTLLDWFSNSLQRDLGDEVKSLADQITLQILLQNEEFFICTPLSFIRKLPVSLNNDHWKRVLLRRFVEWGRELATVCTPDVKGKNNWFLGKTVTQSFLPELAYFLDEYFSNPDWRRDASAIKTTGEGDRRVLPVIKYLEAYLSPLLAIFRGISEENSRKRGRLDSSATILAMIVTIALLLFTRNYGREIDLPSEDWEDFRHYFKLGSLPVMKLIQSDSFQSVFQINKEYVEFLSMCEYGWVTSHFGENSMDSGGKGVLENTVWRSTLPDIYMTLMSAFGSLVANQQQSRLQKQRIHGDALINDLSLQMVNILPNEKTPYLCCLSVSYVNTLMVTVTDHLQLNQFSWPSTLAYLPTIINFLSKSYTPTNNEFFFLEIYTIRLQKLLRVIEEILLSSVTALSEKRIRRNDLEILTSTPEKLDAYGRVMKSFELDTNNLSSFRLSRIHPIFEQFVTDVEIAKAYHNIIRFLQQRGLYSHLNLIENIDIIMLNELNMWLEMIKIQLPFPNDVYNALSTFSKDSILFSTRYDASISDLTRGNPLDEVCVRTRYAITHLEHLVRGDGIRVEDLKTNLSSIVIELQQRRRTTIINEMSKIAEYFKIHALSSSMQTTATPSSSITTSRNNSNILEANLNRFTSALTLLRYREEVQGFRTSLLELELLPAAARERLNNSEALAELQENFLLSYAPELLTKLLTDLHRLSYWQVAFISKLQLSALLLSFFKRFGENLMTGALERAQNRAANNEHASRVLLKILPVRDILEPFYMRTFQNLEEIQAHLNRFIHEKQMNNDFEFDDKEPQILTELLNLSENWAVVEIYFRDGVDPGVSAGDIERLVHQYLSTGRYISHLHPMHPKLTFTYRLGRGEQGSAYELDSNLLQEQVQCAVLCMGGGLNSNKDSLYQFIESYDLAQKAHSVRLLLEKSGHPLHQHPETESMLLSESLSLEDLQKSTDKLQVELQDWRTGMEQVLTTCPRLRLLTSKARLRLILACENPNLQQSRDIILAYVVQCFPTMLLKRQSLASQLDLILGSSSLRSNDVLERITAIIRALENLLASDPSNEVVNFSKATEAGTLEVTGSNSNNNNNVSVLDTRGASFLDVLYEHLTDMISLSKYPAQPGMVIWGHTEVSEEMITELLAIASVPELCNVVHIIGVDLLSPIVREKLIRGILASKLACPLLLVFGTQQGSDAFSIFDMIIPQTIKQSFGTISKNIWWKAANGNDTKINNNNNNIIKSKREIWVVGGGSGSGKSRWILEHSKTKNVLKSVIHEGFTVHDLIQKYEQMLLISDKNISGSGFGSSLHWKRKRNNEMKQADKLTSIALYFDVTPYADFPILFRFLEYMFTIGLLVDESTGKCIALDSDLDLSVYIELPCIQNDAPEGTGDIWPAADGFNTSQHPYIRDHLPILGVITLPHQFISITSTEPYVLDEKSRLVAYYFYLFNTHGGTFGSTIFPSTTATLPADTGVNFTDQQARENLELFFNRYTISIDKRIRSNTVAGLHSKILYLCQIQQAVNLEIQSQFQSHLSSRFTSSNHIYYNVFQLFMLESTQLASDYLILPTPVFFTITPTDPTDFEVLVASTEFTSKDTVAWANLFPNSKRLDLSRGSISPDLRAQVAPAFGMRNTADFWQTLNDCGHLLTTDSFVRVLHLHGRRCLGCSVIYEGETGAGKSQNLHLYSFLVNRDASLFTNIKLHLLAVLKILGETKLTDPRFVGDENMDGNIGLAMSQMDKSISSEDLLQVCMRWIRQDPLQLSNEVGLAVCAYFTKLFLSYPLYREGMPPVCEEIFNRYSSQYASSESSAEANTVAITAEMLPFLPNRPDMVPTVADNSNRHRVGWNDGKADNMIDLSGIEVDREYVSRDIVDDDEDDDDDDNDDGGAAGGAVEIDGFREWMNMKNNNNNNNTSDTPAGNSPLPPLFSGMNDIREFLQQLLTATPRSLYHRILADETLSPEKWRQFIQNIIDISNRIRILSSGAVICVFVDELNTASALGIVSEAFTSHSMDGEPLPQNIFFVGAINPLRKRSEITRKPIMDFTRLKLLKTTENQSEHDEEEDDEGDYLARIPYIVRPLSLTMMKLRLLYPNLNSTPNAERSFLEDYFKQHIDLRNFRKVTDEFVWEAYANEFMDLAINLISRAQSLVTDYHIPRVYMSIRNLIRAVKIFQSLLTSEVPTARNKNGVGIEYRNIFLPNPDRNIDLSNGIVELTQCRQALIMSIALTYLFQLPSSGHVAMKKSAEDYQHRFVTELAMAWCRLDRQHSMEEFIIEIHDTIRESLAHLWSYAQIPAGIAPTTALQENLYSIILASSIPIPLLITGPPGSGKTLSFSLAASNMVGTSLNHCIAFQHLKKCHRFPYQCSVDSNTNEIASLYSRAIEQQEVLDRHQPGRHICIAVLDEAGLPPERRQALKSLHDVLEKPVVGTVLMGNNTLDAAKTNRTIQLLQTQANLDDLFELAKGLLTHNLYQSNISSNNNNNSNERALILSEIDTELIRGLCTGFHTIETVIKDYHWFHSRDFVYLCRQLRRRIDPIRVNKAGNRLFTAEMLISVLRRNFQHVQPTVFPTIVAHFLTHCKFDEKPLQDFDKSAEVLQSLRESLTDTVEDHSDPALAHCRYTLVLDPTDSEYAVDLLFAMKLLDPVETTVLGCSDFLEDNTPTRRTALLAQIKEATEQGKTLFLVNSGPIQSALYDVINRHYAISISETGEKEAFANIALGSLSRYVRVHPQFRLVVHIASSALSSTPLPFLNRMEKFTLSVSEVLQQRIEWMIKSPSRSLSSLLDTEYLRKRFLDAVIDGMNDFVKVIGSLGLYGFVQNETVPALVLQWLEEVQNSSYDDNLQVKDFSFQKLLRQFAPLQFNEGVEESKGDGYSHDGHVEGVEGEGKVEGEEKQPVFGDMTGADDISDFEVSGSIGHEHPVTANLRTVIRGLNFQLMEMCRLESIHRVKDKLSDLYLKTYLDHQEHLTVTAFIVKLIALDSLEPSGTTLLSQSHKIVLYTRTDAAILRFSSDLIFAQSSLYTSLSSEHMKLKTKIHLLSSTYRTTNASDSNDDDGGDGDGGGSEATVGIYILPLATFLNSVSCRNVIESVLKNTVGSSYLIVVADMKRCTSAQLTFVRHLVDESLSSSSSFSTTTTTSTSTITTKPFNHVIFLSHTPAEQLYLSSCYQTISLNGWRSCYIDSFYDGYENDTSNAGIRNEVIRSNIWIRVGFGLLTSPSKEQTHQEFKQVIKYSLLHAINNCHIKIIRPPSFFDKMGLVGSRSVYQRGDVSTVIQIFETRKYITDCILQLFSEVWGRMLDGTLREACERVTRGLTSRGVVDSVRTNHVWLLTDFLYYVLNQYFLSNWSLEAICKLPEGNYNDFDPKEIILRSKKPVDDDTNNDTNNDNNNSGGGDKGPTGFFSAENIKASLTIQILETLRHTSDLKDKISNMTTKTTIRVDCGKLAYAPQTPLYYTLASLLKEVVFIGLNKSRTQRRGYTSQLVQDEEVIRHILQDTNDLQRVHLHQLVLMLESSTILFDSWLHDFMCTELDIYPYSSSVVVLPLCRKLCETVISHHIRGGSIYIRNIFHWMLLCRYLKSECQSFLQILPLMETCLTRNEIEARLHQQLLLPHHRITEDQETMDIVEVDEMDVDNYYTAKNVSERLYASLEAKIWKDLIDNLIKKDVNWTVWMVSVREVISSDFITKLHQTTTRSSKITSAQYLIMKIIHIFLGLVEDTKIINMGLDRVSELVSSKILTKQDFLPDCLLFMTQLSSLLREPSLSSTWRHFCISCLSMLSETPLICQTDAALWLISALLGIGKSDDKMEPLYELHRLHGKETIIQVYNSLIHPLPDPVRIEFLKRFRLLHEASFDNIQTTLLRQISDLNSQFVFISPIVEAAVTPYLLQNIFKNEPYVSHRRDGVMNQVQSNIFDLEYFFLGFEQENSEKVPRTIVIRDQYIKYRNELKNNNNTTERNHLIDIRFAASQTMFVNFCVEKLIDMPDSMQPEDVFETFQRDILKEIITSSPILWSTYLLCQIQDLAKLSRILHNKGFLENINCQKWYTEPIQQDTSFSNAEDVIRNHEKRIILHSRLSALRFGQAVIQFEKNVNHVGLLPFLSVASVDVQSISFEDETAREAAEVCQLLLNEDLNRELTCSRHIPILAKFFEFVHNKFAYRFTEEETYSILLEDALTLLSPQDSAYGSYLLDQFLPVWNSLADLFLNFDQCQREFAAAAPIPKLTNKYGENPPKLSYFIEYERSETHESGIARMLEQRLIKKISEILNHSSIVRLRASPRFNRNEWLLSSDIPSSTLDDVLADNSTTKILLGVQSTVGVERVSSVFSDWLVEAEVPVLNLNDGATGSATAGLANIQEVFNREADNQARINQMLAHQANMVICPQCSQLGERTEGCDVLSCGGVDTPYGPAAAARGCGTRMDFHANRVPMPVPGQPLHPRFKPTHVQLPDHLLAMPPLPIFPSTEGRWVYDWLAIARYLLSRFIAGKTDIKTIDRANGVSFFKPLPLRSVEMISESSQSTGDDVGQSILVSSSSAFASTIPLSAAKTKSSGVVKDPSHANLVVEVSGSTLYSHLNLAKTRLRNLLPRSMTPSDATVSLDAKDQKRLQSSLVRMEENTRELQLQSLLYVTELAVTLLRKGSDEKMGKNVHFNSKLENVLINPMLEYEKMELITKSTQKQVEQLLKTIGHFSVSQLPIVIDIFTHQDVDSISTSWPSLCVQLPASAIEGSEGILEGLLNMKDRNPSSVDGDDHLKSIQSQLQQIGSFLLKNMNLFESRNENANLKEVPIITSYLFNQSSSHNILKKLLTSNILRVKHVGSLLRWVRNKISVLTDMLTPALPVTASDDCPEGHMTVGSSSLGVTGGGKYQELIPDDWKVVDSQMFTGEKLVNESPEVVPLDLSTTSSPPSPTMTTTSQALLTVNFDESYGRSDGRDGVHVYNGSIENVSVLESIEVKLSAINRQQLRDAVRIPSVTSGRDTGNEYKRSNNVDYDSKSRNSSSSGFGNNDDFREKAVSGQGKGLSWSENLKEPNDRKMDVVDIASTASINDTTNIILSPPPPPSPSLSSSPSTPTSTTTASVVTSGPDSRLISENEFQKTVRISKEDLNYLIDLRLFTEPPKQTRFGRRLPFVWLEELQHILSTEFIQWTLIQTDIGEQEIHSSDVDGGSNDRMTQDIIPLRIIVVGEVNYVYKPEYELFLSQQKEQQNRRNSNDSAAPIPIQDEVVGVTVGMVMEALNTSLEDAVKLIVANILTISPSTSLANVGAEGETGIGKQGPTVDSQDRLITPSTTLLCDNFENLCQHVFDQLMSVMELAKLFDVPDEQMVMELLGSPYSILMIRCSYFVFRSQFDEIYGFLTQ